MDSKNSLLIERLASQLQDCLDKQSALQHFQNQSFQQHQFNKLLSSQIDFINTLILLYRQQTDSIPLLDRLAANPAQHATCLLAFCPQITQLQERRCSISHLQSSSQSPILALFLAKTVRNNKIHLVVSDKSLLSAGHILVNPSEIDKVSFMRQELSREGVILHSITYWNRQSLPFNSGDVLVFDVFGLNPIDYSPLLLQTLSTQPNLQHTYIYHSQFQDQQIKALLSSFNCHDFVPLQIWPQHPREITVENEEGKLLQETVQFLRQDIKNHQRQDVVIFCASDIYLSQLQDQLAKAQIKDQVQIIAKPNQSGISSKKGKIFVVETTRQLQKWNYDYSNVFLAIDYGKDSIFKFDYSQGTYVKYLGPCSQIEKVKRMAQVSVYKSGRYICINNCEVALNEHYIFNAKEISTYLLKMLDLGLSTIIDKTNERIAACLELMRQLKIIKEQNGQYVVLDERVIEAAKKGIVPVESKLVYQLLDKQDISKEEKNRQSNLLLMGLVIWHNEHSLRQSRKQRMSVNVKPKDIWRRSGYLQSCLQVLTKCQLFQSRKKNSTSNSQSYRRNASKVSDSDLFSELFMQVQRRKSFEDLDIIDLSRHYGVNADVMMLFQDEIDNFRQALSVEQVKVIFEPNDLHEVINHLLPYFNKAVAIYSGSRKNGFSMVGKEDRIMLHKQSLASQLNERPQFLFVLQFSQNLNQRQILTCNSFSAEHYLKTFGQLVSRLSCSQSETQVEFHGVASSTFEQLWKDGEQQIIQFEKDHECFVQPNQQMALIRILCNKDIAQDVRCSFQLILNRIRQQLLQGTKIVAYLPKISFILGAGGLIKQIVRQDYINLTINTDELEDLFNDLVVIKSIQMINPQKDASTKTAIIHFHSPNDYNQFKQHFHGREFYGRHLQVKPLKCSQQQLTDDKQYIEFKWYAWKSRCKGMVKYSTDKIAQNAMLEFNIDYQHNLDDAVIEVTVNKNQLLFSGLKSTTNEIYLTKVMKAYGKVEQVQILRIPLKETEGEGKMLQLLILEAMKTTNINLKFTIMPIDKLQNGLRTCRVQFRYNSIGLPQEYEKITNIVKEFEKNILKLGQGRLYASASFQSCILIPRGWRPTYQWILREYQQSEARVPVTYIAENEQKKTYLMIKSKQMNEITSLRRVLNINLQGSPIFLTRSQKIIVFTGNGLANLLDFQDRYQAKFNINMHLQLLSVCVPSIYHKQVHRQIQQCLDGYFFYSVSMNRKSYKFFRTNPDELNSIRIKFDLQLVQIQMDSRAILLKGSAVNVQKAFDYLLHFIESLTVPEEKMINSQLCGICCEEIIRSYRLQCGHKFCRECLVLSINTALGNSSLFPLRCPQCQVNIVIKDIDFLMPVMLNVSVNPFKLNQWQKLHNIAISRYVGQHSDIMTFCCKPGCKQIEMYKGKGKIITCELCHSHICTKCKLEYHSNSSCEEAEATKKYMKDNNVRKCANPNCGVLVMKYSGCCNVICTICKISMCFKCDPDNMLYQKEHSLIYKHLTEVHGGYFD